MTAPAKTNFEWAMEGIAVCGFPVSPKTKQRYDDLRRRRLMAEEAQQEPWINGVQRADGSMLFGFDTDNLEFARGFEAGEAFFQMSVRPDAFSIEVHASNLVVCKRAAKALNREHTVSEKDGSMGLVYEIALGPLPERPAPRMPVPMPQPHGGAFDGGSP